MNITEMVNILFVSATVPYPATDGGRIRVLNLISRLCQINKVTLLTFIASPGDERGVKHLREMGVEVVGVRWKEYRAKRKSPALCSMLYALRSLKGCVQGKPLTVAKYYSAETLGALRNILNSYKYDIIHLEMLHTGQYLKELKGRGQSFTVLGEQNIDSSVWYRLTREESNLFRKLIFYWQYRSFMRYESRICRHFDLCICVSEQDRGTLESLCPGVATAVVPNGVDIDYFKPGEFEEKETDLVFTGSMDWQPNEDAALYFCNHILPLIRAELPEVKFYIVGSNPTQRVLKLRGIQGVIVTGLVDDVRPYIESAAVYIVPLRIGGGTRLKILQALAMRKAIVSTTVGCEGLDLQPGKHLMVADEPQQFAVETVRLIKDRALRRRLGENGAELVREVYDWDVIVKKLDKLYRELILEC